MYRYTQTVDPASEPITLTEAKAQLRVDFSDDDTYITSLISAARDYCERYTGRQFVTATWTLTLADFPRSDCIIIQKPDLISVTSVTYYDNDDNSQTYASSNYNVVTSFQPGMIELKDGSDWPTTYNRSDAVTVTFTAGYGADTDVPELVKQAIKIMVSHWYEQREPIVYGAVTAVPMSVDAILGMIQDNWF